MVENKTYFIRFIYGPCDGEKDEISKKVFDELIEQDLPFIINLPSGARAIYVRRNGVPPIDTLTFFLFQYEVD